jgi:hypothetical protein
MKDSQLLILAGLLSRARDVLEPGERIPFRACFERLCQGCAAPVSAGLQAEGLLIFVDGQVVETLDASTPVGLESQIAVARRRGPVMDVAVGGRIRRLCLT